MSGQTRSIPITGLARPSTRRRELEANGVLWIDLPQPVNADIAFLRERLNLDQLALDDVLSTIQRPKLDVHEAQHYLFLILQVPVLDRNQRVIVNRVALFVGEKFIVTIHDGSLKPVRRLFAAAAGDETIRTQFTARGTGYMLYRTIDALIKQTFPLIYQIDEELESLESRTWSAAPARLLRQQAQIERDLIALHHIIQPNLAVCDALRGLDRSFFQHNFEFFFGDNADGMYKLNDLIAEQRDVISSLHATLATRSVQQHGTAQRVIAITLLAIAPLVLLSAVATLVLAVPPTEQPIIFALALLAAIAVIGGLVGYGWARRWF